MKVELYVESTEGLYDRLDMFDDENINIKYKLKDSGDLAKTFSTFSQTFTVPTSKKNRRLLNYYFNTEVLRGGSRYLKAKIYVNKQLFKVGFIAINEGKFKDNRDSSYSINFFTSLYNLKELFGDETLSQTLKDIPYDIKYEEGRVYLYAQNKVSAPTFDPDVIYPLISNKRVWSYNDGELNDIKYTGTLSGVKQIQVDELRPAIPFSRIMDNIATAKGLTFTSPLFGQDEYEKLYVWCNSVRMSDYETQIIQSSVSSTGSVSPWSITGNIGDDFFEIGYAGDYITNNRANIEFNIVPKRIYNNNEELIMMASWFNKDTNEVIKEERMYPFTEYSVDYYQSKYIFKADELGISPISPFRIGVKFKSNIPVKWTVGNFTFKHSTGNRRFSHNKLDIMINLFKMIPEIKTIDFLSSFIKMFNISIIEDYIDPTVVNFIPRNELYNDTIDYTPYIDINNHTVKDNNLYKTINFKHKTSKYKSNEDFKIGIDNREYGELKYTSPDKQLKDEYKIDTQFAIVPNRLIPNTNVQTFYGFTSDSETNDTYGTLYSPNTEDLTIFYYNGSQSLQDEKGNSISLNFKIRDVGTTIIEDLNTYNKVSIVYNDDPDTYINSLGFKDEVDVLDSMFVFSKNLFTNYYAVEIDKLYNPNSRLFVYDAYLPPIAINDFNLGNIIVIGDRRFSIEEADLNIVTGKAKLTLMNISPGVVTQVNSLTPPTTFTATLL